MSEVAQLFAASWQAMSQLGSAASLETQGIQSNCEHTLPTQRPLCVVSGCVVWCLQKRSTQKLKNCLPACLQISDSERRLWQRVVGARKLAQLAPAPQDINQWRKHSNLTPLNPKPPFGNSVADQASRHQWQRLFVCPVQRSIGVFPIFPVIDRTSSVQN